ncbi:MAG: translation elongation factor Ts [Acidiferrobacterales bacterium]
MAITAAQVKELREMTGLGMMECKQALTEANGDQDAAIDILRKKAGAKVDKKASRIAADGAIAIAVSEDGKKGAIVEVNSETDFVAKGDEFLGFSADIAKCILDNNPNDIDALMGMASPSGNGTIAETREALVSKLGENMNIRRFDRFETSGLIGSYVHGRKIGVVVVMEGGDEALAKDIAMHVAASKPHYVNKDEVPDEVIAKEKEILVEQAKQEGKPADIVEKMVVGRVNKFLNEICLLGQPFVKDPDTTVEKLLKGANATVRNFVRFEVGEGMEKKDEDFAAEVMAQVKGA